MPLSYKIIKKHRVGVQEKNFEIPITPTRALQHNQANALTEKGQSRHSPINQEQSPGEDIIQEARRKAQEIINQATQEAQEIRQKAHDEGYQEGAAQGQQEGYHQGLTKAMEETQKTREQARAMLQETHRASREYIHQTQEEIIDLATTIAQNIIHYTIDMKDENILGMVSHALRSVEERKQITLRSHPDKTLFLQSHLATFQKICPQGTFTFLEDQELGGGDCIIETEAQIIPLKIDEQIENIKMALLEMRQNHEI